jgi:peroxiredoxin
VLEVNVQEDADSAAAFFEDRDLTLPLLLDAEGEVYQQYGLQGLPDSFFVDREGNIAAVNFGYLPEETMRERLADAGLP